MNFPQVWLLLVSLAAGLLPTMSANRRTCPTETGTSRARHSWTPYPNARHSTGDSSSGIRTKDRLCCGTSRASPVASERTHRARGCIPR
ncbi:hypothetical protein BJX61DRAFT_525105 [Aspergillus egyptiacus]|nr:hypothetical protein BJX61DRAFT_525105 [Aspergillus egyptiacus]